MCSPIIKINADNGAQVAMQENPKLLSFRGAIGRLAFIKNFLLALLLPTILLIPSLLSYFLSSDADTSFSEATNPRRLFDTYNGLGMSVVFIMTLVNFLGVLIFFVILIGLQVRRGRDIFWRYRPQIHPSPWLEAFLVAFFYLTRGFFGLGGLALLLWPGGLHKQRKEANTSVANN